MDSAQRDKIWRIVVVALCAASLLISVLAFYGIKRLESDRKPHVHLLREVRPVPVDGERPPQPAK